MKKLSPIKKAEKIVSKAIVSTYSDNDNFPTLKCFADFTSRFVVRELKKAGWKPPVK